MGILGHIKKRVSRGVPAGGQFAADRKAEPASSLDSPLAQERARMRMDGGPLADVETPEGAALTQRAYATAVDSLGAAFTPEFQKNAAGENVHFKGMWHPTVNEGPVFLPRAATAGPDKARNQLRSAVAERSMREGFPSIYDPSNENTGHHLEVSGTETRLAYLRGGHERVHINYDSKKRTLTLDLPDDGRRIVYEATDTTARRGDLQHALGGDGRSPEQQADRLRGMGKRYTRFLRLNNL